MASEPIIAYLSLGSNIDPQINLPRAVALLARQFTILRVSSVYQTAPQGYTDQADFLNAALGLTTTLTIEQFKTDTIAELEQQLGRVRDPHNKNAPRTIDIDIALWDDLILDYGAKPWHVPEPDILRFGHVAIPLAEIAPDYIHPETGQTLGTIAATLDGGGFIKRADITLLG